MFSFLTFPFLEACFGHTKFVVPSAVLQHPGLVHPGTVHCLVPTEATVLAGPCALWSHSTQGCPCSLPRPLGRSGPAEPLHCWSRSGCTTCWARAVSGVSQEGPDVRDCSSIDAKFFSSISTCIVFCLI